MAAIERSPSYGEEKKRFDLATLLGLLSAFGLIALAISTSSGALVFLNLPAILIVLGGTAGIVLASASFADVKQSAKSIKGAFLRRNRNYYNICYQLMQLSQYARTKGLIALQNYAHNFSANYLLSTGITMLSDGMQAEEIEMIITKKALLAHERRGQAIALLRKAADVAPAMGLIGTLVGLVQMLGNLNSPDQIGPAMAVALLTTFYGALLANLLFNPLASKLEKIAEAETLTDQLYVLAIASMGRLENPRRLEILMNTILPPSEHVKFYD
ncbi:MAG: motility protein A [Alphaproteobacteria bacterium]